MRRSPSCAAIFDSSQAEELRALEIVRAQGEMNGAAPVVFGGDVGAVPPAAGNVEHVAFVESARPYGVGGRGLVGFDVPAQRLPSRLSPEAPDLLPPHLEDVDVVVVPVVREARRGPPGRIEVHPGVVGQAALYLADQHADGFVKGVDAVENDGGAVAHEGFEPPRIHRAVPRRMRSRAEVTARVRVEVLRHVGRCPAPPAAGPGTGCGCRSGR